MKQRVVILFLLIAVVLSGLTCRPNADNPNHITFWTLQLSPVFDTYINGMIAEFEQQNPGITVTWVDIPYDAAVQKLMAAYISDNPPDVVNLSSDFLAKFAGVGVLQPLTDLIPDDSLKHIYLANALEDCTFNNQIIALPWYLNTYCVLYNRKLLLAAGYGEQEVPQTFTDAVHFIKQYKERTGKYATSWNIGKNSYLPMLLGSEGISLIDEDLHEPKLNSPQVVQKVDEWVQLYRAGYLPRESIINTGSSMIEAYQSATVAWVLTGPVFLRQVKDNAPTVYKATGVTGPLTGSTGFHELATMSLSVTAKSKSKKASAAFARFITNEKNQLAFCKLATIYPSTSESLRDSFFIHQDGSMESHARVMGAKLLPEARRLRQYLKHHRFDELNEAFDEAIQKACSGELSTQQAMNEANEQWKNIIRKK